MKNCLIRFCLPAAAAMQILLSCSWGAQIDHFNLRGKKIDIHIYPGSKVPESPGSGVFFVPGDGGWRGFAITIAESLSSWGYNTYGIDTKDYLEMFTGNTTLTPGDVMKDYHSLGLWMEEQAQEPVTLLGWSEGGGLGVVAASLEDNRDFFNGLVTLGLGESNILGWRKADYITYITHREPDEPKFLSSDYIAKVSPLPFFMIQSEKDEYVPRAEALKLFSLAQEPKKYVLIEKALNHQYDGNTAGFFRELKNGLRWINLKR
jgi:fermentation-respiration switch protein FrsA (DUF1100 family)